jgi:NAD+ diphosphatase
MELPSTVTRELAELAARYGSPLDVTAPIDDSFTDPIWKRDRFGEVCMVVRRPNGRVLLSIKTFYPRGAHRLPTGGIHHGEGVYDALVRETHEETGLVTEVRRFLGRIAYAPLSIPGSPPVFHTFAFLLDGLPGVAEALDHLTTQGAEDIGGDWRAWGKFRAVVHRVVHEALTA